MYSIGQLSERTAVKIPTIRYYEEMGLLASPERTSGNQRRYDSAGLQRLSFIKHARELGFSIEAIASFIDLQEHPDSSCGKATTIADAHLIEVKSKIKKLRSLQRELERISKGCDGGGVSGNCYVLASLSDHHLCSHEH